MSSVIVFSKDRPMQLHAYLESLIWASGCQEEQIYVLYREVSPVCYDKVKRYFPYVHWIVERKFIEQLQEIIAEADGYIMFGCDDVVFMDKFDLQDMERYIAANDNIFGFSLRLGNNIKPMPKKIQKEGEYCTWSWENEQSHYGYPWELDCTLYRKSDITHIIEKAGGENIKSPNYLESVPEENPKEYVSRKQLAAYFDRSKAIVITVNRVQETHQNEVDSSQITDVLSLFIKYQYEDRILDLKNITKCKYDRVHVGSEYFKLTPSVLDELDISRKEKWKNFLNSLRYLGSENLEQALRKYKSESFISTELQKMTSSHKETIVLNPRETVQRINERKKSFCRFGDGEFTLMLGKSIGFQEYNPQLAVRLWEIFSRQNEEIDIGIPYQQLENPDVFNDWIREFYYTSGRWVRKFLNKYLPQNRKVYLDTGFNQVYQTYNSMNFAAYYEEVREIFKEKPITVIAGKNILNKLSYDVFALAESVEYIYGPTQDAFSHYEEILEQALKVEHNRIICIILGPTSKVLVDDLTNAGYIAWDIGHLAKDYDAYRKRLGRTKEDIGRFYAPD